MGLLYNSLRQGNTGSSTSTQPVKPSTPTVPSSQTLIPPVVKTDTPNQDQSFLDTAQQAYENSPLTLPQRVATAGLGKLANVLSIPLKAFGGFLKGTRDYSLEHKGEGVTQIPAAFGAGIKNIPNAIKNNYTPGNYLTEDLTQIKNPIAKAGLGLATDLVVDPLNFAGAGMSKLGQIGKKSGATAKIATTLKSVPGVQKGLDLAGKFKYGYGLDKSFLGKYEELQKNLGKAGQYASDVASPLKFGKDGKELPQTVQRIIGDLLSVKAEGAATSKALTPAEAALAKQYGPIADKTLREFVKLAEEQIKLGKDPAIFERLLGKYYGKNIYSKIQEAESVFGKGVSKTPKLDLSVYKARKDISPELATELGKIKEPAYGAALSAYAEKKNIELTKFYRWVAKKYVDQGENLVKLPDTARLGPISGRMVPKQISDYITQVGLTENPSSAQKIITAFKKGKTVLSPSQLIRNTVASQVQAYMNPGGSSLSITRLPEAVREVKTQGKYYKMAKDLGLVGTTFPSAEIGKFAPEELSKFGRTRILGKLEKAGGKFQNTNEEIAKMQVFINEIKAGRTPAEAAKMAETTGFNYQKVSPTVANLRSGRSKLGPLPFSVPFLTYPLKAAELTGKTLAKNPERLANIAKVENAVQNLTTPTRDGGKYMPDYLKESVQITNPDKKGTAKFANTKYLYPWGNLGDISPIPLGITPDPIYQELLSQTMGKDVFSGKPFGNSPGVAGVVGRVRHAGETFLPSPFRTLGKFADSVLKNNTSATANTPTETILQGLGLPVYKYNPAQGQSNDVYQRSMKKADIKSSLKKFTRDYNGKLPPVVFKKIQEYYLNAYKEAATTVVK